MRNWRENLATSEGRKYIHERLINFARAANTNGKCAGLAEFIRNVPDTKVIEQIHKWIKLYTPIRIDPSGNDLLFIVPTKLKGTYDFASGSLNPYYSIELVSIAIRPKLSNSMKIDLVIAPKTQLNDTQFKKKNIKLALDKFFDDPCSSNKQRLIELIEDVPMTKARRGSIFVQGGSPGSSRR
ncbi:unannotated protein [freshwater metagenome]|uniref:Unannotated protein n=1 Tax=freshwater metagenome TaxID=449393 RepID=A0A6J7HWB6_9ZZZZ|nr:hypothetical protein [Actinomycetota bacterium]